MKNIIIVLVMISLFSCKAQSIIVPLGSGDDFEKTPEYYKKDVNNEFDKFVGTWKYTSDNTELTFKLKKEIHYQANEDYNYIDLLVGEYQYIENGVEKVNTLSDLDDANIAGYDHTISGGVYTHITPSYCIINSDNQEIKILLNIADPNDFDIEGDVILHYVNENGVDKLQVCIRNGSTLADDENASIVIPDGFYEFEKQD